jgi:hypothetical protein
MLATTINTTAHTPLTRQTRAAVRIDAAPVLATPVAAIVTVAAAGYAIGWVAGHGIS